MTQPYNPPPALVGSHVGNYVVESLLGQGGMGEVYLARHPELGREVAVKVLGATLSADATAIGRFRQEAMAACRIGHDAIVEILDIGQMGDGRHYYVMEHLRGQSLHDYLQETGLLSPQECLDILRPVLAALAAAHAVGIVHRDIKPDNIFLARRRDSSLQVKVLDFGIAKLVNTTVPPLVATRSGALIGTPLFMSPEQCAGTGDIGPATDIYAVGAVLFNMLTGRPPFIGEGVGEVLVQHMQAPPPSVRDFRPELGDGLDAVLQSTLAKRPEERFGGIAALAVALETAILGAPGHQPRPGHQPTPADATVRLADSTSSGNLAPAYSGVPVPRALSQTSLSAAAAEHVPLPQPAAVTQTPPSGNRTVVLAVIVGLVIGAGAVAGGVLLGRSPQKTDRSKSHPPKTGAVVIPADAGAARRTPPMASPRPRPAASNAMTVPQPIPLPAPMGSRPIPLVRPPNAHTPPGTKPGPAKPNEIQIKIGHRFLKLAKDFYRKNLCTHALKWAQSSYRYLKAIEAIRIIGICACRIHNEPNARWAYGLLGRRDRQRMRAECKKSLSRISLPK